MNIKGGDSSATGLGNSGGSVNLTGGGGTINSNGGDINADPGSGAGTGVSGTVFLAKTRGNVSVGGVAPTARLHLPAGTATAGTAPAKMTAGTLLAALELGALEFVDNGVTSHLYITVNIAGVLTRVAIV